MTISSEQPLSFNAAGNGVTTVFDSPANMAVTKAADWRVFFTVDATGVKTEQLAGFTVVDAGTVAAGPVNWKAGARFTFAPAPPTGTTIVFERDPDLTQETSLDQHGDFAAERVEGNDDKLTILFQVLAARFANKTLRLAEGSALDWAALEPAASKYIGLDASKQPVMLAAPVDTAQVSAAMEPVLVAATLAAARTALGLGALATAASVTLAQIASAAILSGFPLINGKIVASRSGNAETIAIKTLAGADPSAGDPVYFVCQDETQATGAPDLIPITSAQSVVIPDTATVGMVNAEPANLWVLGFNSGAAFGGLAVVKAKTATGIVALDESALLSTTAIGTGSDSAGVIYSTGALTAKPMRILARLTYTLAAVGVWDTAPSVIHQQGAGSKKPGDIVQYVPAIKTDTATIAVTVGTFADITGLSVAIPMTNPANAVKIDWAVHIINTSLSANVSIRPLRGATAFFQGDAAGSRTRTAFDMQTPGVSAGLLLFSASLVDLVPGAGTVTYKLQVTGNYTENYFVNRSATDTDTNAFPRGASIISAWEIAA